MNKLYPKLKQLLIRETKHLMGKSKFKNPFKIDKKNLLI